MPYMDEAGLAYYSGKLKPWIASQPVKTLPSTLYPWKLTDKAGAVTCWPVGGTQLLPTVDCLFSETGPADGTKGPDNPSTIAGVSSITVTRCETVGVDSTDYVIDLGGTYYGGEIDLATGLMTVTHVKMIFDGNTTFATAGFSEYTSTYKLQLTPVPRRVMTVSASDIAADTLSTLVSSPVDSAGIYFPNNSSLIHIVLSKSGIGVADGADRSVVAAAFNSWFENHQTSLVYPLAAPTTVQLTPTQILSLTQPDKYTPRLNTIYTDAIAVQVGYVKSPIREEYELQQAIVAQGGSI